MKCLSATAVSSCGRGGFGNIIEELVLVQSSVTQIVSDIIMLLGIFRPGRKTQVREKVAISGIGSAVL